MDHMPAESKAQLQHTGQKAVRESKQGDAVAEAAPLLLAAVGVAGLVSRLAPEAYMVRAQAEWLGHVMLR